jgi:hypothetical protein
LTADVFARAVLTAEGMKPDHEKKWVRTIAELFSARYGPAVS